MISYGGAQVTGLYFGTYKIIKRYYGDALVYSAAAPQLATPENVEVDGTMVSFTSVENAEEYEFIVDGVSIGTYEVEE